MKYCLLISISFFSFGTGCAARQKEIRAYIEENPIWKMVENCGYENCLPMVDFLTGKDISTRLEFFKDQRNQFFVVHTEFTTVQDKFEFNPSAVKIKLSNGETLKPKGFTCSQTVFDLHYLRSNPSLQGPMHVREGDCFLLFFDRPVPQVEEELVMNIDEALTANGRSIDVPLIYFRKNVAKQQ